MKPKNKHPFNYGTNSILPALTQICKISNQHYTAQKVHRWGGHLLGCDAIWSGGLVLTFWRNLLPPSSCLLLSRWSWQILRYFGVDTDVSVGTPNVMQSVLLFILASLSAIWLWRWFMTLRLTDTIAPFIWTLSINIKYISFNTTFQKMALLPSAPGDWE